METMNLEDLTAELFDPGLVLTDRPTRTKPQQDLAATVARPLDLEDIELADSRELGSETPQLKTLRDSHHRLAQLLARGVRPTDAALLTGYSVGRISVLQEDPAFKELLSQYRESVQDAFADTVYKMKSVTDDSLGILQERLLDNPDSFSNGMLVEVISKLGDRAGYSPVSKSLSVSANLDLDKIAELKERVKARQLGKITKIVAEDSNGIQAGVSEDTKARVGEVSESTA